MATTSIWAIKKRLDHVLDYAMNPDKTAENHAQHDDLGNVLTYTTREEKVLYISGLNCLPETAKQQMEMTKHAWNKTGGRLAFHGYQSFLPGETTPEQAHEIGVEFARRMWGNRFQVVVATHIDQEHLHNHFVINSVSFVDGKKYTNSKSDYWGGVRKLSDQVCREYGLSVIEHPKGKGKHYKEALDDKAGRPTPRRLVQADVNEAIEKSLSFHGFIEYLQRKGYEVKYGEKVTHIAIRPKGSVDFMRLYKLIGAEYEEAGIRAMIEGKAPVPPVPFASASASWGTPKKGSTAKRNKPRRFKLPQQHRRHKGIVALYYKYLYMLGKAGNRRIPNRAGLALRADLKRSEQYKKQFRFLYDNKIETDTQLDWYADALQSTIEKLVEKRKPLYKILKRMPEWERPQVAAQIDSFNVSLRAYRSELRLCMQIKQDIPYIQMQTSLAEKNLNSIDRNRAENAKQPRLTVRRSEENGR